MPVIQSAKKRVRVSRKASVVNAKTKRTMRSSIKNFQSALNGKKDTTTLQNEAYSAIDMAAKKGVISKNKAARKKSQLNSASKSAGTTKTGKQVVKKTPTPKTKASKSPAKKPAPKKPVAKKTTVKKSSAKK